MVTDVKEKAYDELYEKLNTKKREKDQAGKTCQQVRMIKNTNENVLTREESVEGKIDVCTREKGNGSDSRTEY